MKHNLLALTLTALVAGPSFAGNVTTDGEDLVISTKSGLKLHTADKSKSFQVGGRLQWDYDDTSSDANDSTDLDVRRARLYIKGSIDDWSFKAQFNIAEDSSGTEGGTAEDLYIQYTGFGKQAKLTLGKQNEPFGLERLTSSNDIPTLERSAATEFYTPGRSGGLQVSGAGSNWTYGIGLFEADGDGSSDFDDTALTGRVTFNPSVGDGILVHVGAGFSTRDGATSDDEVDQFNLELAGTMGPFHAQAEYFDAEVGDTDADAYYLQVGYVITGETRPYKGGKFKRIKAADKGGAWEVVLRLEDGEAKYSDIGVGTGEGSQTTLGLNWYLNNHIRLGVSYMDGENDSNNQDGDELRLRTQLTF